MGGGGRLSQGEDKVMVLWEGVQSFYLLKGLSLCDLFWEEEKVDAQSAAQKTEKG